MGVASAVYPDALQVEKDGTWRMDYAPKDGSLDSEVNRSLFAVKDEGLPILVIATSRPKEASGGARSRRSENWNESLPSAPLGVRRGPVHGDRGTPRSAQPRGCPCRAKEVRSRGVRRRTDLAAGARVLRPGFPSPRVAPRSSVQSRVAAAGSPRRPIHRFDRACVPDRSQTVQAARDEFRS